VRVFFSWSGERSRQTAEILSSWLEGVIQAIEPWMSHEMEKGSRWIEEIPVNLETSKMGIICLTDDNLKSPWILFEAGALSKTREAKVCTFLLDVSHADVEYPLAQFQHTAFKKDDIKRLVKTVNEQVRKEGENALSDAKLDAAFEHWWPDLEEGLNQLLNLQVQRTVKRTERELLEEILEISRRIEVGLNNTYLVQPKEWDNITQQAFEKVMRGDLQQNIRLGYYVHPAAIKTIQAHEDLIKKIAKNIPSTKIKIKSEDIPRASAQKSADDARKN
jgi:hypothetical protein